MKKLWLFLAAVGSLAACDDKLADDQQTAQDPVIVNVSATSALDYQWQATDAVKLVFNADASKEFALVPGSVKTQASFSYDLEEVKDVVPDENVYAVFPASVDTELKDVTVGGAIEKKLHMTYSLSAVQDGVISAEENLSYAVVKAENLNGETAVTAQFCSPFAVLDVTLPQGVKSVTFSADRINGMALAGDATVQVGADAVALVTAKNTSKTLTLENAAGLPVNAKVLVLPGNSRPLAVKMDGLDGAMYETSVLANTTFEAGKVYSVNLAGDDVFSINYSIDGGDAAALGQTVAISPLGADMTVSVVSLHEGQPTVTENADWISVVEQTPVRSFHSDAILLQIAGNTTPQERQAEVTVNYGQGKSKTFTVTQGTVDMSIVKDENGEDIVWEESFGLFNSSDVSLEPTKSFTNKFTISISDDFAKGAYVIRNMFYAESYFDENLQLKTNKGADYYADMEADKLIVYKKSGGNSYPLSDNKVILNYNRTEKTFAAAPIALTDGKYIGNYAVKVFVEQPPQQGSADIAGTWNQSVTGMSWPAPSATMTIAVHGSTVTITDFVASGTKAVGTLEGNTITIPKGTAIGSGMSSAGNLDSDVILTISEDGKSISAPAFSIAGWVNVSAYSATKK